VALQLSKELTLSTATTSVRSPSCVRQGLVSQSALPDGPALNTLRRHNSKKKKKWGRSLSPSFRMNILAVQADVAIWGCGRNLIFLRNQDFRGAEQALRSCGWVFPMTRP